MRNVEEGVIVSMALDRVIRSSLVGAISVQIVMTISAMVGGGGCGSWRSGWRGGWRGVWRGGWHEIFPTIDIPLRCCPNEYSLLDIIFEISCHHTGDLAMVPGIVE